MIKKHFSILSIVALLAVSGCEAFSSADKKADYPKSPEDVRRARAGSLIGDGGFTLFGGKKGGEESSGGSGIGINSYLWRASLDTVSFMPLASADPFGGVIITDWYEDSAIKGERFKVNLLILSRDIRSNSVKVTVFKQTFENGLWRDAAVDGKVGDALENKILTRARELRIEKESR